MTSPASVGPVLGGRNRYLTIAVLALVAALLGVAAGVQVMRGSLIAALCLVPYLGLLWAVWWLTRGNLPVLVFVAYMIAPSPADNLLPQVFIYPQTDLALRARDLVFLADLVLAGALLAVRPPWPPGKLARAWIVSLLTLAAYPVLVGVVAGVGQTAPALFQGAMMPLRGVGVVLLVAWWARTRGWDDTVRDLGRTLILCGAVVAAGLAVIVLLSGGELNFSLFGYPLVTDGRPALPGWGNNILANFLCCSLAALTFLGDRLGWRRHWRVALAVLLFVGLAYTEVRIAMMLALLVTEVPVVLALIRWLWPRRGAVIAVVTGLVGGAALFFVTLTVLLFINPRFTTITPPFLQPYIPVLSTEAGGTIPGVPTGQRGVDQGGDSISTRAALLRTAVQVWERDPVLGTGWNGWGWAKTQVKQVQQVAVDPHNGFTWLLADAGLVGVLLLYVIPVMYGIRRWDLWWLMAIPGVATALELLNPNLRNGHFAVLVWGFLALAFAAEAPERRYTFRRWLLDASNWIRGREPVLAAAASGPAGDRQPAAEPGSAGDPQPAAEPGETAASAESADGAGVCAQ